MGDEGRNILLLVIDCLRADMVYEKHLGELHNVRGIINGGTAFTHAFTSSVSTMPSFSSILTGLYPARHGVVSMYGRKLRPWVRTLAQVMRKAGYYTRAEVSGPLDPIIGLNRGFIVYNYRRRDETVYTEWWRKFLKDLGNMPQPWFLLLHLWALHMPRYLPPEYDNPRYGKTRYERALIALDEKIGELLDAVPDDTLLVFTGDHGEYLMETPWQKLSYYVKWYFKKALRKVSRGPLSFLREFERRISLPVGHGFDVRDILARIPLVFKAKGLFPSGIKVDFLVSNVDIFPTIISAVGIRCNLPYRLDGIDLYTAVKEGKHPDRFVIIEAAGVRLTREKYMVAVRGRRYKYVLWPYSRDRKEALYDLERDPQEKINIVLQEREIAELMRKYLETIYLPYHSARTRISSILRRVKRSRRK